MSYTPSVNNSSPNYNIAPTSDQNTPVTPENLKAKSKDKLEKSVSSTTKNVPKNPTENTKSKSELKAEAKSQAKELKNAAKNQKIEAKKEISIKKTTEKEILETLKSWAKKPIPEGFEAGLGERNYIMKNFLKYPEMREVIRNKMLDSKENKVFANNVELILRSPRMNPGNEVFGFMLLAESTGYNIKRQTIDEKARIDMSLEGYEDLRDLFMK